VHAYRTDETLLMVRNHNRCMELCNGYYINLLRADDLLEPTFIERCMDLFGDGGQIEAGAVGLMQPEQRRDVGMVEFGLRGFSSCNCPEFSSHVNV
jgi:hypothetical protein